MTGLARIVCILLLLVGAYFALPTGAWVLTVAIVTIIAAVRGVLALRAKRGAGTA